MKPLLILVLSLLVLGSAPAREFTSHEGAKTLSAEGTLLYENSSSNRVDREPGMDKD